MSEDLEKDMQARVARLVGLKRHERPDASHYVGISRAVRFRIEQERMASGASNARGGAGVETGLGWLGEWRGITGRWLEPRTWVPTLLAALVVMAWVLEGPSWNHDFSGRTPIQTAGFGSLPEVGLGMERPKVAPLVGVHLRIVFLDSDQLQPGFVAFPPLPPGLAGSSR